MVWYAFTFNQTNNIFPTSTKRNRIGKQQHQTKNNVCRLIRKSSNSIEIRKTEQLLGKKKNENRKLSNKHWTIIVMKSIKYESTK